jgi:hypothetical protein
MNPRDERDQGHRPAGDLREQLSALIDGALPAEQARFLLRRLQHDAALSGRWERWQLAGEVLRGSGVIALPAGFPARVAAAIASDGAAPARTRWGRHGVVAALAASVAAVALFVARPAGEGDRPVPDADAAIAVMPAVDVPFSREVPTNAGDIASVPQAGMPVRVAEAGLPRAEMRPEPRRSSAEPAVSGPPAADTRVADVQPAAAISPASDDSASPFRTPQPPETRPWPRASLPGLSGGELFTAGYTPVEEGAATGDARPFAPSPLSEAPVATDGEPDAP